MMKANIDFRENSIFISNNFFFLWIATTISAFGDYIYQVAIVVHLYKITGSPTIIGGYFLFQFIPSLILTPIVGTLIDHWNKKHILIYTNIIRALAVGFLFIHLSTKTIYITAVVLGIIGEMFGATKNSIIPQLTKNNEVIRANSLITAADSVTMIIGPVIGSVLIAVTGIYGSISINAITFVMAAILMFFIKFDRCKNPSSKKEFFKEMKEGLQVVTKNTLVKRIILIWGLLLTGIGPTGSLLIISFPII